MQEVSSVAAKIFCFTAFVNRKITLQNCWVFERLCTAKP